MDEQLNYRVNVDDSEFQAKLTQMRTSMDMTMGGGGMGGGFGGGGMGGGFGGGQGRFLTNMAMMQAPSGGGDFSQIQPISYTPPAMAMQPHMGMIAVQQNFSQSAMGALGFGVPGSMFAPRGGVPNQISSYEYRALSARNFADRIGDATATTATTALSFGASMGGGAIGGIIGGAVGGPVGALVGSVLGGMATDAVIKPMVDMVVDNRQVQAELANKSFRFITGGKDIDPITGRGLSRDARNEFAKSVQRMANTDPRYAMSEYKEILGTAIDTGMLEGSKDAEDAAKKLSNLVKTVKTVSTTLHTSLKEATQMAKDMQDIGIDATTDPTRAQQFALKSEVLGRVAGRTGQEMMAIGREGAELFRGTGVSMELGAMSVERNLAMIRTQREQGLISLETIQQAGGEVAFAKQQAGRSLSFMQSREGVVAMMANYDLTTGRMKAGALQNMQGQDLQQMVTAASRLTPTQALEFEADQEELISKMSPEELRQFEISTNRAKAREVMKYAPGMSEKKAYRIVTKKAGKSYSEFQSDWADIEKHDAMDEKAAQHTDNVSKQVEMDAKEDRGSLKNVTNVGARFGQKYLSDPTSNVATAVAGGVENISLKLGRGKDTVMGNVNETLGIAPKQETVLPESPASKLKLAPVAPTGQISTPEQAATAAQNIVLETAKGGSTPIPPVVPAGAMVPTETKFGPSDKIKNAEAKIKQAEARANLEATGGMSFGIPKWLASIPGVLASFTDMSGRPRPTTATSAIAGATTSAPSAQKVAEDTNKKPLSDRERREKELKDTPSQYAATGAYDSPIPEEIHRKLDLFGAEEKSRLPGTLAAPSQMVAQTNASRKVDDFVTKEQEKIPVQTATPAPAGTTSAASTAPADASKKLENVALDTQKQIDLMSKQLMAGYQQLIALQRELNNIMPTRTG